MLKKSLLFFTLAALFSVGGSMAQGYDKFNIPITGVQQQTLVHRALAAKEKAYAPYSNYPVGAALMTIDYEIFEGCNVENASYGLTNCAERSAIFSAISQGKQDFAVIAVATKDGGSPCGACRQVLNEFNPNILVILVREDGHVVKQALLSELLPEAFGPNNLN